MKLSVKKHCIETAAKREYQRLAYSLQQLDEFSNQFIENAQLLELLEGFLRVTDFSKLRAERPELAGGSAVEVEIIQNVNPDEIEIVTSLETNCS